MTPQERLTFYLKSAVSAALKSTKKSTVTQKIQDTINPCIDAIVEISSSSVSTKERLAGLSLWMELFKILLQNSQSQDRRRIQYKDNAIAKKRVETEAKKVSLRIHDAQQKIAKTLESV